jgi:hypothetical protein
MNVTDMSKAIRFYDGMSKIAGVGWDIHGYAMPHKEESSLRERIELASQKEDEHFNSKILPEVGRSPSRDSFMERKKILGLIPWGSKSINRDRFAEAMNAYREKVRSAQDRHPFDGEGSVDLQDKIMASKIRTPYDRDSNYKLNANVQFMSSDAQGIDDMTSDFGLGDKIRDRPMSREDLISFKERWNRAAEAYAKGNPDSPHLQSGVRGFNNKIDSLLANEKAQFYRAEWE